jgi:iron complex transport system ATP-binding protein
VRIAAGEVFVILGANGAGKSTLLRLLAGEMRPNAGRVFLAGRPVTDWPAGELARVRAVLPQASALRFPLRVHEVVRLGRSPHAGLASRAADAEALSAAMEHAGVRALADRAYQTLSGGEQQRVQLARVLAQLHGRRAREAALLLDEPTAALDLPHQHAVPEAAQRRARAGGAVVVVLHDLTLAARYANDVLLLREGCALAHGPPESVLDEPRISAAFGVRVRAISDPASELRALLPVEESEALRAARPAPQLAAPTSLRRQSWRCSLAVAPEAKPHRAGSVGGSNS